MVLVFRSEKTLQSTSISLRPSSFINVTKVLYYTRGDYFRLQRALRSLYTLLGCRFNQNLVGQRIQISSSTLLYKKAVFISIYSRSQSSAAARAKRALQLISFTTDANILLQSSPSLQEYPSTTQRTLNLTISPLGPRFSVNTYLPFSGLRFGR